MSNVDQQTLTEFEEFAIDHIAHLGFVPCEFENSKGQVFPAERCWEMALQLSLTALLE